MMQPGMMMPMPGPFGPKGMGKGPMMWAGKGPMPMPGPVPLMPPNPMMAKGMAMKGAAMPRGLMPPMGKGVVPRGPVVAGRGPPGTVVPLAGAKRPIPANAAASAAKRPKLADEMLAFAPERCDNCGEKEHTWESCPVPWKCRICDAPCHTGLFCHKSDAASLEVENVPAVPVTELAELFKMFAKGHGMRVKGTYTGNKVLTAGQPAYIVYSEAKYAAEAREALDKAVLKSNTLKVEFSRELERAKEKEEEENREMMERVLKVMHGLDGEAEAEDAAEVVGSDDEPIQEAS